jgi:biotin carboxyl carrier protein
VSIIAARAERASEAAPAESAVRNPRLVRANLVGKITSSEMNLMVEAEEAIRSAQVLLDR